MKAQRHEGERPRYDPVAFLDAVEDDARDEPFTAEIWQTADGRTFVVSYTEDPGGSAGYRTLLRKQCGDVLASDDAPVGAWRPDAP